jgi:hypothetical protein
VRFEWYNIEGGSGSIGRVVVVLKKGRDNVKKWKSLHTMAIQMHSQFDEEWQWPVVFSTVG